MTISKELLDELLKGCERPEDLLGDAGLMKELKIKLMERKLSVIRICKKDASCQAMILDPWECD